MTLRVPRRYKKKFFLDLTKVVWVAHMWTTSPWHIWSLVQYWKRQMRFVFLFDGWMGWIDLRWVSVLFSRINMCLPQGGNFEGQSWIWEKTNSHLAPEWFGHYLAYWQFASSLSQLPYVVWQTSIYVCGGRGAYFVWFSVLPSLLVVFDLNFIRFC